MNARRWVFAIGPVAAAVGLGGLSARHAFGPVWSALYAGIGAAGWRLSGSASRRSRSLHLRSWR